MLQLQLRSCCSLFVWHQASKCDSHCCLPFSRRVSMHSSQSMLAAGAYISMGYSLCSLVGGQLSKEFRLEQPGAFNFLFGIFGARVALRGGDGPAAAHWGGRLCRRARHTAWGGRLCCRLLWLLWLTWQR